MDVEFLDNIVDFMSDVVNLFRDLKIEVNNPITEISKKYDDKIITSYYISSTPTNIIRYFETVGYRYNLNKNIETGIYTEYLKYIENKDTEINKIELLEYEEWKKMIIFFSSLYDGSAKRYPYCAPFLFIPLYKCNLSSEFRAQLIRMHQERIGESLKAWTIKGWQSLNTRILLQGPDGSTLPSTVRELLLSLPASPGMVTSQLFISIEPQVNSAYYLAVYAAEMKHYWKNASNH
jgi:hypothetical protein